MLDVATISSLARTMRRVPAASRDPLDSLYATHDRARLFCGVLRALAEDPFQPGREAMALSLLQCANDELAEMLHWEAACLAPAVTAARYRDGKPLDRVAEFLDRHRQVTSTLIHVVDALDQISRGGLPLRAADFAVESFNFAESMESYLRWEHDVLLPLARTMDDGQLADLIDAFLRQRRHASSPTSSPTRALSA
jgi:hypothetical protein